MGGMTRMPAVGGLVAELFGREPHRGVNPDEVVALGAAIQAGVISGEVKDVLLLDVTPLSLGIETLGGVFTKLVERNTTIPVSKKQVFSTAEDSQTAVTVHVLQGERELAAHNRTLGRFNLDGLPPARRGLPQIEVAFDLDADGILHVSAKDLATGKAQQIRIEASSGLSESEIQRMVRDAEQHADEDQERKRAIEARNRADQAVYATEKSLAENGDKLEPAAKAEVERALEVLRDAVKRDDTAAMESAMVELERASHKMAEALYRNASTTAGCDGGDCGGGSCGAAPPGDGNTMDADFTVVNN